jgi:transcriptional regulator GlxA family with amidase domain
MNQETALPQSLGSSNCAHHRAQDKVAAAILPCPVLLGSQSAGCSQIAVEQHRQLAHELPEISIAQPMLPPQKPQVATNLEVVAAAWLCSNTLPLLDEDALAASLAAHSLHHHSNCSDQPRTSAGGLSKRKLIQVIDFINAHLSEDLSLAAIAREVNISLYHFVRLFKASTGLTPHQYLMQQRIARAMQLLRHTDLPIAQVAIDCGFANQSHFARYFRRFIGVSPRQFRRS